MWDENKDFEEGLSFKENGNYSEAFKSFDKAREDFNGTPQYWHCAGHMLLLTGENEKAENYLKKAAELYEEEDHEECFWIGAVYGLLNDKKNALKYLKKAIQLDNFSNRYREKARNEEDYTVFYEDPDFIEITRKRTPEEISKEFSDFYLQKMKDENISFKETDKSGFDFYLAAPFLKKLFIPKSDTEKLRQLIKDYFLTAVYDSEGNITDIKASADMWQIELFEGLAGFIKEGSYIIFIDDTEKFWKIEFQNKKVKYFRE